MSLFKNVLVVAIVVVGLCHSDGFAQTAKDISGRNWTELNKYSEVTGSPFLFDDWVPGTVKFADQKQISVKSLKYDLLNDVLLFKNEKEEIMEVAEPVLEFTLTYTKDSKTLQKTFRSGFKASNNNTAQSFYEILFDGQTKFVKRTGKTIVEEKEYNATTATRKLVDKPSYFIVKANNMPLAVGKNEKSILSVLEDKSTELKIFIKDSKLNLKNDADIVKLLVYYDELSKK